MAIVKVLSYPCLIQASSLSSVKFYMKLCGNRQSSPVKVSRVPVRHDLHETLSSVKFYGKVYTKLYGNLQVCALSSVKILSVILGSAAKSTRNSTASSKFHLSGFIVKFLSKSECHPKFYGKVYMKLHDNLQVSSSSSSRSLSCAPGFILKFSTIYVAFSRFHL